MRLLLMVTVLMLGSVSMSLSAAAAGTQAPAFTHTKPTEWINSPPLTWAQLRGKVVLLDVWTFDCWNCYRSLPWVNSLKQKFPQGFEIVGVHTPELPQEYELANVRAKVREFGVTGPVMLDNDYSYWNALENRYWPAFYLVDTQGQIRARFIGETHADQAQALRVEEQIRSLLEEERSKP